MQERDMPATSEKEPSHASDPPHALQNQESGWAMAFKALFWLIFLPSTILLLFKWLMTA